MLSVEGLEFNCRNPTLSCLADQFFRNLEIAFVIITDFCNDQDFRLQIKITNLHTVNCADSDWGCSCA
jgi:hypothetical protein